MSSSALLMTLAVAVVACAAVAPVSGKTRTYYIAAVEEDWDYAPAGNLVNDDTATSDQYLKNGPDRIGSVYLKAMLREFTDESFTVRAPREPYLGLLGPHLRAEEGDRIVVVFRNLAFISGRNFSVHPHGLQYEKDTEGALYVDNTSGPLKRDDGVPPGHTYTYVWDLPSNFANTKDDDPCLPWAYHSHTFPLPDVDTGLVGLLTTCKRGTLKGPDDRRRDVQAEYPLWVETTDESASWLFQENLKKCGNPDLCRQLASVPVPEDGLTPFQESNIKQHVNGLMYGNLQGLRAVARSQPVAFYFFGLSRDIKSIFVSGQIFSVRGQSQYAVQVYPATFVGTTMTPAYPGSWLLASKITEAYTGGQEAFFNVVEDNGQYTSHTDDNYPGHADHGYPRNSDNSYSRNSDDSYTRNSDNSHPRNSDNSYTRNSDNSYPGTSYNSYPRYTDNFPSNIDDFDFGLGTSSFQRPSTNSYHRPSTSSFRRPTTSSFHRPTTNSYHRPTTVSDYLRSGSSSYPTLSGSSHPRSTAPNYRGKRSADFMNIERVYSSNPEQRAGSSHDHVQGDGLMAYQAAQPAPTWDGALYWTQGNYSGTQNYKGAESADRHYYLDIEDYVWDYAPSGQDLYFGGSLTDNGGKAYGYFSQDQNRIGGRYLKTRYVLYSDGTFSTRVARGDAEEHLGFLGPVLQVEVGETVAVHVRNSASRPYSFFPHGMLFSKDQEGFVYRNPYTGRLEGRVVVPGESLTYHFLVPPLDHNDNPCVANIYQSALDPVRDLYTGLVGPLLVCQRGQLSRASSQYDRPYGPGKGDKSYGGSGGYTPASSWYQQHKHFYLNFFTVDENLSWHLRHNIDTYAPYPGSVNVNDPGFVGSNRRYAINGLSYGNLQGLDVCRGQNVAWHLFGVGDRASVHGTNFHGQSLDLHGNHLNSRVVIPGVRFTLTSTPETLGQWSVACRTNFHFQAGMVAKYQVVDCPGVYFQAPKLSGEVREYFLAAEEVYHDYAPVKIDSITGQSLFDESLPGFIFVRNDTGFIGTIYKKARYIQYTDASFSYRVPLGPEEEHLGVLGPVVAAEVGDRVRVTFYNKASRPYSIHPQGVQYDKDSEGALYVDGAPPTQGDSVPPGGTFTYEWTVPPSAGPGPSDPSCTGNMYYSSVDSVKDVYSGLIGPLLICRPGTLASYGPYGKLRRRDVDRDFWQLYSILDENESWYLEDNTRQFAPERFNMPGGLSDPKFVLSNSYHSINGKIYANLRGLNMEVGDVVAWYLLGYGSAMDFHPVHYHGQTFVLQAAKKTHRGDVLEVFPSTSETMTMLCDNPGEWLVHCHFQSHAVEGMETTYIIRPRTSQPYAG